MTQIIFQAIVACCCIYTVYRLSLFISVGCPRAGKTERMSAMFLLKQQT